MTATDTAAPTRRVRSAPVASAAHAQESVAAPAAPAPDLLERMAEGALDRLVDRSAIVKHALQQHPEIRAEAVTNPELVDLIVAYVLAEFDVQLSAVIGELRALYGGEVVQIAKLSKREREQRAADVLRLFNGRNASEVARRLQISVATVYRVIKQPRKRA